MPLRLWWKVKGIGHLRPVRKVVHRLGRHGNLQVFLQTFYEAPEQPEPALPERIDFDELLTTTKVSQWYDNLKEEYEDEVGRVIGWADPAWGLKEDDWSEVVTNAHKTLNETYGSDRVVVLLPANTPSLGIPLYQNLLGLPYFGLLGQYSLADITHHTLDELGLPYVYWHAVASTLNEAKLNSALEAFFRRQSEARSTLLMEQATEVRSVPIPDTVLDPSSKKVIQTDDYLKRLLPSLEEALSDFALDQMRRVRSYLPTDASHSQRDSVAFVTYPFRYPETRLALSPAHWDGILDWVKGHPETLKALFTFVMPTGDRDVALLGLYAGIKAMKDFVELCATPEGVTLKASEIMERVRESFERRVEESKQVFGLEKFPIPARRVWETLWLALECLHEASRDNAESAETGATVTLRELLRSENWWWDKWDERTRQTLKHLVGVLFGHDAVKGFDDEPFRSGRLGKMLDTLWYWGNILKRLGLKALGEDLDQLKEKVQVLDPSEISKGSDHIQVAQKTVRKFHNAVSSIIRNVQKVKDWFVWEYGKSGYLAAIIDFSPLGFYSLTTDGTCFGKGNFHHPFILSALEGSFVLRVFAPRVGYLGRMWGILLPDAKTAYLTNRYGNLNINHFKELARQVFVTIFQVHPDNLSIESDENEEIDEVLATLISKAEKEINSHGYRRAYTELPVELPYLNRDAFKVRVKG
jgi:hypothetical protein